MDSVFMNSGAMDLHVLILWNSERFFWKNHAKDIQFRSSFTLYIALVVSSFIIYIFNLLLNPQNARVFIL